MLLALLACAMHVFQFKCGRVLRLFVHNKDFASGHLFTYIYTNNYIANQSGCGWALLSSSSSGHLGQVCIQNAT